MGGIILPLIPIKKEKEMEQPKFQVNDLVILKGIIAVVQCHSLERGWMYKIELEGASLEDRQMNIRPTIHEKAIELDLTK